jgi:hypothetical protein
LKTAILAILTLTSALAFAPVSAGAEETSAKCEGLSVVVPHLEAVAAQLSASIDSRLPNKAAMTADEVIRLYEDQTKLFEIELGIVTGNMSLDFCRALYTTETQNG